MKSIVLAAALIGAATAHAAAQQTVPIRELGATEAKSVANFGLIMGLRHISANNNVLVNDGARRQLVMLDASLSHATVVIDSAAGAGSYGPRGTPLIPFLGDSSLFLDPNSLSILVLDGSGKVARVMSAPRPGDLRFMLASSSAVDDKGRLVYRGVQTFTGGPVGDAKKADGKAVDGGRGAAPPGAPGGMNITIPQQPDSAPILRADFETRQVDTIGRVKVASGTRGSATQGSDGKMHMKMVINPLSTLDEWAVMTDGSIAFVRGHDYHVDLVHSDGSVMSAEKLPFDWKRLTDEDKQKLIDSARTAQDEGMRKAMADAKNGTAAGANADKVAAEMAGAKAAMAGGGGGAVMFTRVEVGPGGGGAGAAPVMIGGPNGAPLMPEIDFVPLNEIADYYPPIRSGAAKADMDGNLWILPTTSAQSKAGELVYDVVDNKGNLTERVRLPVGRSIAGFGKGGIVYLMSGDRTNGFYLERARVIGGKRATQ
ncbi:MAG TPA: hypothetical protein VE967_06040 [Gemmatimonadaceae bacterium]|nr:hypothetical protein [Gemmatimonadaceae bacterium]